MGIIVTPPGRRNRQAETASQSAQRLRGLGMPETRGKNARGQNVRNEHAVPAISETTSISEISAAAETSTAIATTEQSPEPAKPTLRDLAGVKPSDKPTEQDRPKRDRPRLVFQPIHAVIAILTLSCALCASLTMLIQQAVHYSALQQSQITQSEQSKANGTEKDKTASTQTTPSQQPSTEPDSQSEPTSGPAEPADPADGLLNINTAGSDELQTLKGVGPVTAQRIIDYRNQYRPFRQCRPNCWKSKASARKRWRNSETKCAHDERKHVRMAGWGAGEQGLASAAGRPMRVGGELGHAYGIRLLRRTGWSVRHAAARCGIGGTVAGIIGIIGIAVPAIAYAASAGWRAAGGLGMAFQHYRMRGRGDGMRVFRVDLRRIAMERCGLVRGQKRRKRRCHAGTYDISRSEFEQTCKRLPD